MFDVDNSALTGLCLSLSLNNVYVVGTSQDDKKAILLDSASFCTLVGVGFIAY